MQWVDRIGRRLKLRDLNILLAVVQRRSMVKAAADLAISQPAVSKAIADLEHTLGLRLLDRSRNGVEPTVYGRALAQRGTAVFDELKQGVEELAFLADTTKGTLNIGSTESMAAGLLPAVIERFSRQYPGVRLNVVQAVISTLHYRELRERTIDLLLGRIPADFAEDDLRSETLFDDQVVVVVGRRSRWARARRLELTDLADAPWILPAAETLPGLLAADLFRAEGMKMPPTPITTLSIHLCCQLAAGGRFVTTMPRSVLRFNGRNLALKVLPIRLPIQPRPVGIVSLKNRTPSPLARLFVDCVRTVMQTEVKPTPKAERRR
jgi:DNA-binding transcriptional LysR family regulator